MRTLGVIGGMSWESTAVYFRLLNDGVRTRLGGLHSASLRLATVDFAPVAAWQSEGRWDEAAAHLGALGDGLRLAGAEALVLATNTMHKVADAIESVAGLPLLHIADATGAAIRDAGLTRVGLLGTRFTVDDASIVVDRLQTRGGVEVIVPVASDRAAVHAAIYDELCRGIVDDAARRMLHAVIDRLAARGAQGVVLGCTELMLLLDADRHPLPVFDTTALHAAAAVRWMLEAPTHPDRTPCP